ncbi:hypothetical protein NDU88_006152 [Pleurodeles waltl]|uniref:Uncharacterized protein n=1 Tax=Pleurodeles waltl TaxID=8319 RepID=A0AAV7NPI7_PLEWA|nr:hypothetical protein NDU88_006152 [Pleurodeles waltl]
MRPAVSVHDGAGCSAICVFFAASTLSPPLRLDLRCTPEGAWGSDPGQASAPIPGPLQALLLAASFSRPAALPRHLTVPVAVGPTASIPCRLHAAPPLFRLLTSLPLWPDPLFLLIGSSTVLAVIRESSRLTS